MQFDWMKRVPYCTFVLNIVRFDNPTTTFDFREEKKLKRIKID